MQFFPTLSSVPEDRMVKTRIQGASAANPSLEVGRGVTVTRASAGVYRYTFSETLGIFVGAMPTLAADTPSSVKGYSFVRGVYNVAGRFIDLAIFNASTTATDLTALQYLDAWFAFAATTAG